MRLFKVRIYGCKEDQPDPKNMDWITIYVAATDYGRAATRAEHWAVEQHILMREIEVGQAMEEFVQDYV